MTQQLYTFSVKICFCGINFVFLTENASIWSKKLYLPENSFVLCILYVGSVVFENLEDLTKSKKVKKILSIKVSCWHIASMLSEQSSSISE